MPLLIVHGALFIAHSALLAAPALAQNTLTLRPSARIAEGRPVTLADIADLAGPDAETLAAVALATGDTAEAGAAPAAAPSWTEIDLAQIRAALIAADFPQGRIALNGSSCAVRFVRPLPDLVETAPAPAAAREPGHTTVRDAITAQLTRFYAVAPADLRLTFRAPAQAGDLLETPIAGRRIDIQPGAADSSSRIPVHIFIFEGDRLTVNETILADAVVRRTVLIARRDIDRRERIAEDDFILARQWVPAGDRPPASAEAAAGAHASERIGAGEVITTAHVEPPIIVSRGDIVSIHCLSGAFSIQIRARALEKGRDGDVIPFRAEGAGRDAKTFLARMSGRGRAVMVTGAAAPAAAPSAPPSPDPRS